MKVIGKLTFTIAVSVSMVSCLSDLNSNSSGLNCTPIGMEVDCERVSDFSVVMNDQFSRKTVIKDQVVDQPIDTGEEIPDVIGWRKIIDDRGRIVADQSGNHVNSEVIDQSQMGPAADGSKYLLFYGRQGGSVHNIYLVSETLSMNEVLEGANVVSVKFKYLPLDLEPGEYLKLDVCNSTVNDCGVGDNIDLEGLNGDHWKTVFSTKAPDEGLSFNGYNHLSSDYITAHVPIYAQDFQRDQFVVRFNVRIDEGFINNDRTQELIDGVLLDSVQITTMSAPDVVSDGQAKDIIKNTDSDGILVRD